ncbi:MAG: hypothetical protein ABIO39_06325 [Caulobacteraceae bacterium]
MSSHLRILAAAASFAAMILAGAAQAAAPAFGPYSQEQLYRELAGLWENMTPISVEKFETIPQPLTPAYQAKKDAETRNRAEGRQIFTSSAQCIPAGMPRMMLASAFEVIVRPTGLGLVTGAGGIQIRNIWTDGRKHTPEEDLFETFSGESVGHWEGDTLVIDTIGLRPTNEFLYGVPGPHMTISERFRKTGPDVLEIVTTVRDTEVFTTPWVYTTRYKRNAARTLSEQNYCVGALDREVNKDGVEGFDLTPPPDPLVSAK